MSAIKVGDLVVVVRACQFCGDASDLGEIFTVAELWHSRAPLDCCGTTEETLNASSSTAINAVGHPVELLKRIPPLEELEGQNQKEDLREPA